MRVIKTKEDVKKVLEELEAKTKSGKMFTLQDKRDLMKAREVALGFKPKKPKKSAISNWIAPLYPTGPAWTGD